MAGTPGRVLFISNIFIPLDVIQEFVKWGRDKINRRTITKTQRQINKMRRTVSPAKEIVLRVLMHCEGCKSKVSKCLKGVEGIEDVTVDYANQRVVVKGKKANPLKVLERLQTKYSSNAELISPKPKPENKEKKEPQKKEEAQPQVKVVVLKMLMHCEGCANDIKKYLEKMKGVLSVEANMESSRVTVRGVVDLKRRAWAFSKKASLQKTKIGEAVVKLRTPVWCRPKALRCLSQLGVVTIAKFGSSELRQVIVPSEEHLPLAGRKTCPPWCTITLG
ncbi:unnamed protein product [Prunus armeniaca]